MFSSSTPPSSIAESVNALADKKKRNKIKIGSFITPVGIAHYPHVNTPDTKWKEEGEYRCPLIFCGDVAEALRPKLEAFLEKAFVELKKEHYGENSAAPKAKRCTKLDIPMKPVEDEDGNETGDYKLVAKKTASGTKKDGTPWKAKVSVFDSKGKKMLPAPSVWGGSKLKADVDVFGYFAAKDNAIGITLELVGVQVIELVSGGSGDRESRFGEVEGGYVAEDRGDFGRGDEDEDGVDDTSDDDTGGAADF